MFRTWAFALPLAAVVAAAVVVPSVMSSAAAAAPAAPTAACTSSTPSVTALSTALTNVQTALSPTPDPAKLAPVAGDLFNAITAAQKDGCLPALPSSSGTPTPPSAPPTPPDQCFRSAAGAAGRRTCQLPVRRRFPAVLGPEPGQRGAGQPAEPDRRDQRAQLAGHLGDRRQHGQLPARSAAGSRAAAGTVVTRVTR